MDFDSGSETVADKCSRSAILASAHAAYELKDNIMFAGVCVRSWRNASEVHVGVSAGHLGVKTCLPGGAQGERGELVSSRGLNDEEGCWPTLHKLVKS